MKRLLGTALAFGATLAGGAVMAGSANASVAYNVGVSTDYIFRGVDQFGGTNHAEAFGGVDWSSANSQFYLGTWVSNTNTIGPDNVEIDLYGGWKPVVGPVTFDLGVIGYLYTDTQTGVNLFGHTENDASYWELKGAATVPLGGASLSGKVYYTPDFASDFFNNGLQGDHAGVYTEVDLSYTFKNKATLGGGIGNQWMQHGPDFASSTYHDYSFATANIGVTYPITDHLSIDGRVYKGSSNIDNFTGNPNAEDAKVVGTLTTTF